MHDASSLINVYIVMQGNLIGVFYHGLVAKLSAILDFLPAPLVIT